MHYLTRKLMSRYMKPEDGDGGSNGGAAADDRGDDFVPTGKDAPGAPVAKEEVADPMAKEEAKGEGDADSSDGEADEGDEAEAEAKDDAAGKTKKDTRIPLARHKDMLDKARAERDALVDELAKYKQGAQVAKVNEAITVTEDKLVEMETSYNELLAEGKTTEAAALMRSIRLTERSIVTQQGEIQTQAAIAAATEEVRYNAVLDRVEAAFPAMNPDDTESYDQASVNKVLRLAKGFMLQGSAGSAALQEAVDMVFGATTTKQKTAVEVTPNVTKDEVEKQRRADALKRNVAAAKGTPADTSQVGKNGDEAGGQLTAERAMKMSQADFAKLDESALAKLRGDEVDA